MQSRWWLNTTFTLNTKFVVHYRMLWWWRKHFFVMKMPFLILNPANSNPHWSRFVGLKLYHSVQLHLWTTKSNFMFMLSFRYRDHNWNIRIIYLALRTIIKSRVWIYLAFWQFSLTKSLRIVDLLTMIIYIDMSDVTAKL